MIQIPGNRKPAENETVFFYVDDGKCRIRCMIHDRTGWDMGWWSGSRWHSYFGSNPSEENVLAWAPIELPVLKRK